MEWLTFSFVLLEDVRVVWQEAATLLPSFFTQVHMLARIPPYRDPHIAFPVAVSLILKNNKKCSVPFPFEYVPGMWQMSRFFCTASHVELNLNLRSNCMSETFKQI